MSKVSVSIVLEEGVEIPTYAKEGDGCVDIKSNIDIIISPNTTVLIPTGISMAIPEGYVGKLRGRSGLASKGIQINTGVIDSGYRGELKVSVYNSTDRKVAFVKGDRIAQLEVQKRRFIQFNKVDTLESSNRGTNGFGSTGV